jgi:L,D-transpeptidase YcbB
MKKAILIGLSVVTVTLAACSKSERPKVTPEARNRVRTVLERANEKTIVSLIAGDTIHISPSTPGFYRRRRWRPAWVNKDELTNTGKRMLEVLGRTEDDGLSPLRYRYDLLQRMVASLKDGKGLDDAASAQYGADVDILLTEAFARYINDLALGVLSPTESGLKWRIPRDQMPKATVLRTLERTADPDRIIQNARPAVPQYGRLSKVLARLQSIKASGGWGPVPAGKAAKGDSSAVVAALRARLARSDDMREATFAQRGAQRPTVFDRDLFLALQHFQQRHAIDPDGQLGSETLEELNRPIDEHISEIKINMDRWRWLPHNLGRMYVLVNVAGFEMSVIERNHELIAMNVVVGQTGWETPIFADTLESMVVNPSWNVPPSIAKDEMSDVSEEYLASHNFVRTKDGGFRQLPGPGNALGQFKFQFPNKDNIYLHDTPADELFSRSSRAFSHGCIRLEHPRELAHLLGDKLARKSAGEVDRLQATGDEITIPFKRKIPIYILYFTTWVDEDGTVRFHHDVYGHNKALENTGRFEQQRAT